MKKRLYLVIVMVSLLSLSVSFGSLPAVSQAAQTFTVYANDRPGWEGAVGVYDEEFFTDATLNPGVSVSSDNGYVDTTDEVWWDQLECPPTTTTTIWQFDKPIIGFGGNWDPGNPGGPGARISVDVNGSWTNVGEISEYYTGDFWGFVATEPFTHVRLQAGSECNGSWCETYELDNMVYSYYQPPPSPPSPPSPPPPPGGPVGITVMPMDKAGLLLPWLGLAGLLVLVSGTWMFARRCIKR